jgi:hypothetical protein
MSALRLFLCSGLRGLCGMDGALSILRIAVIGVLTAQMAVPREIVAQAPVGAQSMAAPAVKVRADQAAAGYLQRAADG